MLSFIFNYLPILFIFLNNATMVQIVCNMFLSSFKCGKIALEVLNVNKEGNTKVMLLNCNSNVLKLENQDIKIYDITTPLKGSDIAKNDIVFLIYDNTKELKVDFDINEFMNKTLTIGFIIHNQSEINQVEIEKFTSLADCHIMVSNEDINNISNIIETINNVVFSDSIINIDLADVKAIMKKGASAVIGIGSSVGKNRAIEAARQAVSTLTSKINEANSAIVNVTGGNNLTLFEIEDAVKTIRDFSNTDISIIFGAIVNKKLNDEVIVTVIAVI